MKPLFSISMAVIALVSTTGCGSSSSVSQASTAGPGAPRAPSTIYAVGTANQLFTFSSDSPGSIQSVGAVSGLHPGESIVGITFSPEGILFALGSTGTLYRINSDATTLNVSANGASQIGLSGSDFGFSFNPITYEIRITTDLGANFRINPGDGTVSEQDTNLAYASGDVNFGRTPHVITSATSCGCNGVIPTVYGIDDHTGSLITVGNVNAVPQGAETGQVFTIGSLNVSIAGYATMSILIDSATAYSTISGNSGTALYKIDLTSGSASLIGSASTANPIRSAVILPTN